MSIKIKPKLYHRRILHIAEADEKAALEDEKIDKYSNQLREYDSEVNVSTTLY